MGTPKTVGKQLVLYLGATIWIVIGLEVCGVYGVKAGGYLLLLELIGLFWIFLYRPYEFRKKQRWAFDQLYRHRDVLGESISASRRYCRKALWYEQVQAVYGMIIVVIGFATTQFAIGVILAATFCWWMQEKRLTAGVVDWDKHQVNYYGSFYDQVKQEDQRYQRELIACYQRDGNSSRDS